MLWCGGHHCCCCAVTVTANSHIIQMKFSLKTAAGAVVWTLRPPCLTNPAVHVNARGARPLDSDSGRWIPTAFVISPKYIPNPKIESYWWRRLLLAFWFIFKTKSYRIFEDANPEFEYRYTAFLMKILRMTAWYASLPSVIHSFGFF